MDGQKAECEPEFLQAEVDRFKQLVADNGVVEVKDLGREGEPTVDLRYGENGFEIKGGDKKWYFIDPQVALKFYYANNPLEVRDIYYG